MSIQWSFNPFPLYLLKYKLPEEKLYPFLYFLVSNTLFCIVRSNSVSWRYGDEKLNSTYP